MAGAPRSRPMSLAPQPPHVCAAVIVPSPNKQMDKLTSAIVAGVLVLFVLILAARIWDQRGWQPFGPYSSTDTDGNGQPNVPKWVALSNDPGRLRFRGVTFTVQSADGHQLAWDVSSVLNGMAAAHKSPLAGVQTLDLAGPLTSASFKGQWNPAPSDRATLAGYYKEI